MIVIVIQPNLAPCDHFGMPRQPFHVLVHAFVCQLGFVGMNSEGGVDEFVLLRQPNPAVHLRRPVAVADGNNSRDPGLPRPSDNLLAIRIKSLAIKMRMRINEHRTSDLGPRTSDLNLAFMISRGISAMGRRSELDV